MVYDQIWLNLLMDDHHFCYIYYLSMDDCYFGCMTKFLMYLNTRFPSWFPRLLHSQEHTGMLMQGVTSLGNGSFWESIILGRSEKQGKASVSRDIWLFGIFLQTQYFGSVLWNSRNSRFQVPLPPKDTIEISLKWPNLFGLSPPHLGFQPHFAGILKSFTN
jgi:hypothetical protein